MKENVKKALDAQDEVNINLRLKRVKRDAFKRWCKDNGVTQTGMLIAFMDDCIMSGKVFKTIEEK